MFAQRLKALREARGYNLEEMADLVGVHRTQIMRWESGNVPNADSITKLAQAFETSTDYLLGLVDQPHATLKESELSTDERQLLDALRNGALHRALEVLLAMTAHASTEG